MDTETLKNANLVYAKLNKVNNLLEQVENIDITTGSPELFPITISAGMACTIDFDLRHRGRNKYLDELETEVYNRIKHTLELYRRQLVQILEAI